jgi:ABC-2 type transport system ATP-binding protein
MAQIEVENLRRTFGIARQTEGLSGAFGRLFRREYETKTALDGITFQVESGELLGYIGPNGAGKSTTIKILTGILVPDSGKCEVDGLVPWKQRIKHVQRIGAVFGQHTQLWWDLPVTDSFDLLRDIYSLPSDAYRARRDSLIDILQLNTFLSTPVRQLSLGQRMRCDIAAALLHSPQILFLDEPTIGLDAVSKLAVRSFVKQINRDLGVTVILTTHDMDDIEALCRRIMVIADGHILADGTLDDLRRRTAGSRRMTVDLAAAEPVLCPEVRGIHRFEQTGGRLVFDFDPAEITSAELIRVITERANVTDLFVEHAPIEEIIAALYHEAGR